MSAIVSLAEIAPVQSSFVYDGSQAHAVALTPEVDILRANCVVAIGVSGGKDSVACALAVERHLDNIGHTGTRLLVHSHLGENRQEPFFNAASGRTVPMPIDPEMWAKQRRRQTRHSKAG
jgi:hypothetical protein